MKKAIKFLAVVALMATSTINAQNDSKNAGFGIKGGVNFSNLYSEDVDDENVLTGFNIGLFTQLELTEGISIQPEINYTTKGAELKYNNVFFEGTSKFKLNYVEIPVLLKVNVTENFNLHAGPYAAFLVSSKITSENANGEETSNDNVDTDDLNKFDYGLAAGVGFDFDSFGIGARYNYGLSTIGKERTFLGTTYTFPDAKNSVISVYAAFKF
jgi:Outer membrane protein beta-barrel domain